ncbi:PREDICTED: tyrosyl-DNA phosphodiesterase 2-like [Amphimedon queenslandica]|uniref:Endonuclease/exonuclease/phosphatase domain-containing protein n=1 Tax=Amphimedon queenslandica TaxID=400682 RepID=A0A1X7VUW5_AMPQE|nr:PREDICTED: tyrosyl-DNA phosphodiesterase 2-like [Amphimedon queenslandica]|eukprot:XP_003382697.1 PREDICTED: tyrosyl-DNA phosphodiesterase 2-like [Amphimedon queenslandica]
MGANIAKEAAEEESGSGLNLKVLSWNIDGLDGRDTIARADAVCSVILEKKPHIIFLQEVVPQTLKRLQSKLGSYYTIHISHKLVFQYFPAILVTKVSRKIVPDGDVGMFDFPGSTMGRHLLQLFVRVCGVPMALYTSHLESMKDFSGERKDQLSQCFEFVKEQNELFSRTCIFGGDLNLRDEEVKSMGGLLPKMVDMWEACGSSEEDKYTWDIQANDNIDWKYANKPRCRFDRLYLCPADGPFVKALSFELVGKERLPQIGRFPSDHWGMWSVFQVSEIVSSE